MSMAAKIPVGDAPGWEEDGDSENELNDILESSAIYHSLRQSRNAWLTTVFPKFTSKSKAKGQKDVVQPPHNLRFVAKCDIEIGPHVFPETSVYEVHYLPEPSPYTTGTFPTYQQTTTYSYPMTGYNPYVGPSTQASSSASVPSDLPPPLPEPSLDVTPALIAQVNEAAATNPTLHNLLQIAAAGEASMDQLRTLGFFIQSLAAAQQQAPVLMPPTTNFLGNQPATPTSAFAQASQYSPPHTAPKKSALVLEFRENHTERFIVPREIIACEQEIPNTETFRKDIVFYTFVPFLNDEAKFKAFLASNKADGTPSVIRFLGVSDALWESIRNWVNEEAKRSDAWESFYDKTEVSDPRTYLQYRIPNGELLSQLKAACSNGYTMKSIKPSTASETASSKRNRSRRAQSQAAKLAKASLEMDSTGSDARMTPATGTEDPSTMQETSSKRRRTVSKATPKPAPPAMGGLYFINTTVPPLPPPPLPPSEAPSASLPQAATPQPPPEQAGDNP
ncbi:uncharacterized protein FOMMEDRAFT_27563 [Fomitiporia mediterranea MF3/22]|uniref:uncharacterized protein n=1 Tax=Fomitiporia mediterranea (strain MF3/22) TaxID=694068 RepID=UPI0004409331|nr:uncharacterized protein FOMMEDRAFT_27563 [Fomitiporia mediterranea MF3/22]EJD03633.1 hypothetical protein FOMMEDRAFT_27563 [Fomitiporia mediterranea MF3/22]